MGNDLNFPIEQWLNEISTAFSASTYADMQQQIGPLLISMETWARNFSNTQKQLQTKIDEVKRLAEINSRGAVIRLANKKDAYKPTEEAYQKLVSNKFKNDPVVGLKTLYKLTDNMVNLLKQGYQFVTQIRTFFTGTQIPYQIMVIDEEHQTVHEVRLTEEQLFQNISLSLRNLVSKTDTNFIALQANLNSLKKQILQNQDIMSKTTSLASNKVLNMVRYWQDGSHAHVKRAMKTAQLMEVYYMALALGYKTIPGGYKKDNKFVHYFYGSTISSNLDYRLGGDVFDTQIKFGTDFQLTSAEQIITVIQQFILACRASSPEECKQALQSLFIQPLKGSLRDQSSSFQKREWKKLKEYTEKETSFLEKRFEWFLVL